MEATWLLAEHSDVSGTTRVLAGTPGGRLPPTNSYWSKWKHVRHHTPGSSLAWDGRYNQIDRGLVQVNYGINVPRLLGPS